MELAKVPSPSHVGPRGRCHGCPATDHDECMVMTDLIVPSRYKTAGPYGVQAATICTIPDCVMLILQYSKARLKEFAPLMTRNASLSSFQDCVISYTYFNRISSEPEVGIFIWTLCRCNHKHRLRYPRGLSEHSCLIPTHEIPSPATSEYPTEL